MSKPLILLGGLILLALVYMSKGFYQEAQDMRQKSEVMAINTNSLTQELNNLARLADNQLPAIEDSVSALYESLRQFSRIWDAKYVLEIKNMASNGHVGEALQPSRLQGAQAVTIKVAFSQLADSDQFKKILKTMSELEDRLPIEIMMIRGFDKNLEIDIQMYGVPTIEACRTLPVGMQVRVNAIV